MAEEYGLHSEFDIKKHKQRFIDYLEVLILEDGTVVYAVPSHQRKAEELCCKKLNITPEKLAQKGRRHLGDYAEWLLSICGAVMVWNCHYMFGKNGITKRQISALRRLKMNGLYRGMI